MVRHKLLVPSKTKTGGWNLTSIVHHTRFMPTSMFGPHCVLQVTRVQPLHDSAPAWSGSHLHSIAAMACLSCLGCYGLKPLYLLKAPVYAADVGKTMLHLLHAMSSAGACYAMCRRVCTAGGSYRQRAAMSASATTLCSCALCATSCVPAAASTSGCWSRSSSRSATSRGSQGTGSGAGEQWGLVVPGILWLLRGCCADTVLQPL